MVASPRPPVGVPTGDISGLDIWTSICATAASIGLRNTWIACRRLACTYPERRTSPVLSAPAAIALQCWKDCGWSRCASERRLFDLVAGHGLPVLSDLRTATWPNWLRLQLSPSPRPDRSQIKVPDSHALTQLVRLIAGARSGERNSLTIGLHAGQGKWWASGLLGADAAAAVIAEAATGFSFGSRAHGMERHPHDRRARPCVTRPPLR